MDFLPSAETAVRLLQDTVDCCGQFRWMTIAACIFGFCMAFGIGANDVANAFATSVSAKSVSLKQAVIIASICEFLGAMLLGASVTSTIKGKMIDADLYEDTPDVLMYGMLTSLVSASFILMVANYLSLPVSTTHTIVGSIIGFSIAAKGFESIKWKEVGKIIISWVASPALTGTMAIIFFYCTRRFILQSENPYQRSVNLYPVIIFLAIGLDLFMVFAKAGSNNDKIDEWGLKFSLPCAFGVSLFLGVVASLFIVPNLIEPRVIAKIEAKEAAEKKAEDIGQKVLDDEEAVYDADDAEFVGASEEGTKSKGVLVAEETGDTEDEPENPKKAARRTATSSFHDAMKFIGDSTVNRDVEAIAFAKSAKAKEMWETGPDYDAKTEEMFSYLQVLTACLLSFAHGANDVANAIAPIAAVYAIYETGEVSSKVPVQKWIIFLGAAGIVVGLALYGYNLIVSLGYKITKLSPSRGFCIELSASTIVVIASYLGIPVSTTQCQVGGTMGVGLLGGAGGKTNLDPIYVLKVFFGWVATFFA
eukprot:scaffold2288_cov156-Alexandrium_tamarense.AAC.3